MAGCSVGAAAAFIRFDDGEIAGTLVSQDYRTGTIARVPIRFGYVVAPLTSVFVEFAPNRRDFRVGDFDSRGYHVVGGMLFEPGPGSRVKGEFFAVVATPEKFSELGRMEVLGQTRTAPSIANGRAYIRDGKDVVAIDLRSP